MKIERSKKWWLAKAAQEGDAPVGAGRLALDAKPADHRTLAASPTVVEEASLAFGRFVNLMRRRRSLSVEQLADKAELDVSEVLVIEDDFRHIPEPRTVYQLARLFGLPQQSLMQLAGLAAAKDAGLQLEAVRFAARSEAVHKLTREENAALEAFVTVLSQFESKKSPQ